MITTVQPGAVFPDFAHLGHLIPEGQGISLYEQAPDPRWEVVAPRVLRNTDYDRPLQPDPFYISSQVYLARRCDEIALPQETKEQFKWRIRDTALAAAERAGVHIDPVVEMVERFGAGLPTFREGDVVSNMHDIATLPQGTVLYFGHPSVSQSINVFEVNDVEALDPVLSPRGYRPEGTPMTIHSLPSSYLQPEGLGTSTTPEELSAIALKAWQLGKRYKRQQNWCTVFENTLGALNINAETVADAVSDEPLFQAGDIVDRQQAATLPEGTVLFRHRNDGGCTFWVRDDAKRNAAKTRRVWGSGDNPDTQWHNQMTVLSIPGQDDIAPSRFNGWLVSLMPDGTVVKDTYGTVHYLGDDSRRQITSYYTYEIKEFPV